MSINHALQPESERNDQDKKETGRVLSLQRALEHSGFKDAVVREVMAGYYSR